MDSFSLPGRDSRISRLTAGPFRKKKIDAQEEDKSKIDHGRDINKQRNQEKLERHDNCFKAGSDLSTRKRWHEQANPSNDG